MSLIKCPECGKEISDKSVQCIHCGYPLNNKTDISQDVIYAGYESNTVKYKNQTKLIGCIRPLLKLDLTSSKRIIDNPPYTLFRSDSKEQADWIFNTLNPFQCKIILQETYNAVIPNAELDSYIMNGGSTIICPNCGSNQITTGQRGFSFLTGFIGSGKTINRCGKCGWKWEP